VLSTGIALLLVPRLGVPGAALAYCCATLAGCAFSLIAVRGFARVTPDRRTLFGVLASSVAMAIVSLTIVGPSVVALALAVALGGATHVITLWLLNVSDVRSTGRRMTQLVRNVAR
ncbi:MAG TPA: polysaccharide biosynthesis C-terminal domain-containing protein, partial [Pseudomonadales bacterium]